MLKIQVPAIEAFARLFFGSKSWRDRLVIARYAISNLLSRVKLMIPIKKDLFIRLKSGNFYFGTHENEMHAYVQIWIWKTYEQFGFVPSSGVIIDVGANIGLYTIRIAKSAEHVFAIEPNPGAYRRLLMNLQANGVKNVTALNKALWSAPVQLKLDASCGSTLGRVASGGIGLPVDTITLDQLVEEHQVQKIDILKIDTEGSELEVLNGASKALKLTGKVVLEYHSQESAIGAQTILENHGFRRLGKNPEASNGILYFIK